MSSLSLTFLSLSLSAHMYVVREIGPLDGRCQERGRVNIAREFAIQSAVQLHLLRGRLKSCMQ